ncbi:MULTISPECIES: colicin immunity domain-containing protein [unclassified Pseudomonas]|uniref:colicin immunity domain-containing protein n=1 Tax=unclassified Pseudomonas TaxID=196821 RepID=UPI00244C5B3F|nr:MULTISPECIES: colicin immunity domain-containing protein [unclassified Pseudomonas]MDH0893366.1 colicin immunity domain-containing protein [Pseudomonas sp. GD03875]MDH1067388.1 colicin immunity domain-containing protein [Pseudomonas sp. GD03985]
MSVLLLRFAKSFAVGRLSAVVFSEAYIELWKIARDKGLLFADAPVLSECLSSIFCAADMYCGDDELREEYEFNDEQLRSEVFRVLQVVESN